MKHRLFISIDLPAGTQNEIIKLQSQLDALHLPLVMQPPEKLHLTLNFIGKYDKDATVNLASKLAKIAFSHPPFKLTPMFLETMYQKHNDTFVYLGLTGDLEILKSFQSEIKACLQANKVPQPYRYLPHITVAKVVKTDPAMTKSILDQVREFEFSPLSEFTVDRFSLFQSILSQKGSTYRRLRQFPLNP